MEVHIKKFIWNFTYGFICVYHFRKFKMEFIGFVSFAFASLKVQVLPRVYITFQRFILLATLSTFSFGIVGIQLNSNFHFA